MKQWTVIALCMIELFCLSPSSNSQASNGSVPNFIPANNRDIQYIGRVDFSNPLAPKFWAPGVYIKAKFKGTYCNAVIKDQNLYGKYNNFLEIRIDHGTPTRIQTTGKSEDISLAKNLTPGVHNVTICKDTESGIGYVEFIGFQCDSLLPPAREPKRKIEFIGDSITCGFGDDTTQEPCGKGQWFDQHNAYLSYGPITARALHAQWHISAYSGIGLIHSCCNMTFTMPELWNTVNLQLNGPIYNVKQYQPDVVTICLGQNDGVQPEQEFVDGYVQFISMLRKAYPKAEIICLTSPMADTTLNTALQKYLTTIVNRCHSLGDNRVHKFFFSQSWHGGCGGHPDLDGQRAMANELTAYLKTRMHW